jgi:hypothetical protein
MKKKNPKLKQRQKQRMEKKKLPIQLKVSQKLQRSQS